MQWPRRIPLHRLPYVGVRLVKNGLLHVPGIARLDAGRHAWRTGRMYEPDYVASILRIHARNAAAAGLRVDGLRCLELGPGNSLGQAFALCLAGAAEVTTLDVRRYATERTGAGVYRAIRTAMEAGEFRGLDPIFRGRTERERGDALLPAGREFPVLGGTLRYEVLTGDLLPVADGAVDLAYSCSVLEHVPNPGRAYDELFRVLRPGGIMSHIIDLRDHHSGDPFDFLRYGDRLWSLMQSRSAGFTNRLRESEHLSLMRRSGFEILSLDRTRADRPPKADDLCRQFRSCGEEDLRTLTLIVCARKG